MAIYKVINREGKFHDGKSYRDAINYVTSPDKTQPDGIIGGAVPPKIAVEAMEGVARAYRKEKGVHLRHSVLSFSQDEGVSVSDAKKIAKEVIKHYEDDYQIIAAVHEDCDHPHIHFVMNAVSYRNGSKYHGEKKDYYDFLKHMKNVVRPYGTYVKLEKDEK